jgi:hypothetical protein
VLIPLASFEYAPTTGLLRYSLRLQQIFVEIEKPLNVPVKGETRRYNYTNIYSQALVCFAASVDRTDFLYHGE